DLFEDRRRRRMRTPGPTCPPDLRGSPCTRWAPPAGRCRLLGHHQAARRRVARPCRGAPDVLSRHAVLRLSPHLICSCAVIGHVFPFAIRFSGPTRKPSREGKAKGHPLLTFCRLRDPVVPSSAGFATVTSSARLAAGLRASPYPHSLNGLFS